MQGDASDFEWVHREGLWNANREGLVSAVGYCCLHLFGVAFGRLLYAHALEVPYQSTAPPEECGHNNSNQKSTSSLQNANDLAAGIRNAIVKFQFMGHLIGIFLLAFLAYGLVDRLNPLHAASRRVANAAFVFWIVPT